MAGTGQIRWGIMGTAGIARKQFLPALREAGGIAAVVAGRDLARAEEYAARQGIGRAVQGYQALLDDPGVDAIYLPLPNSLHAEWTIKALRAGKPVLCEKPLCGTLAETRAGARGRPADRDAALGGVRLPVPGADGGSCTACSRTAPSANCARSRPTSTSS